MCRIQLNAYGAEESFFDLGSTTVGSGNLPRRVLALGDCCHL